jgi:hypothetical protein
MHDWLHALREEYGDIQGVIDAGCEWELEAYLSYWLAGLFVVVEGFNKLKLKDARVQRLFHAHLNDLKELRHETIPFHALAYEGCRGDQKSQLGRGAARGGWCLYSRACYEEDGC